MRRIVVLPQPEGPSSVTSERAAMRERHVVDGGDVAVELAHVLEFDGGGFHDRLAVVSVRALGFGGGSARRPAQAALRPMVASRGAAVPRRPSFRSPTRKLISQIAASISTISTEQ